MPKTAKQILESQGWCTTKKAAEILGCATQYSTNSVVSRLTKANVPMCNISKLGTKKQFYMWFKKELEQRKVALHPAPHKTIAALQRRVAQLETLLENTRSGD